jgi:Lrp/AsnC family transcriptional regulator, leucine-responsive regulatory protein
MAMPEIALDTIDRRLLMLLQQNNRRPLRDLAFELAVSAPTCLRRMRRLASLGIIRAHCALLDAARLGFAVTAFVEVTLVNASGAEMAAFDRRIQRCAEVRACAELAGEIDYMLTVAVHDMREFSDFTRKHLADDRRIKSYRSLLILRQTKNEHALPLESPRG